jgi:hypothetical protein
MSIIVSNYKKAWTNLNQLTLLHGLICIYKQQEKRLRSGLIPKILNQVQ